MALSSGLTGKVTTLLTQAAELAIRGGTECISAELIDQAATTVCIAPRPTNAWQQPGDVAKASGLCARPKVPAAPAA